MKYWIAEEEFANKDQIHGRCQEILHATPDGQLVAEDALPFLLDLFRYHDEWEQKSGGGVRGISTQTTTQGTRCFVLLLNSGYKIDISFKTSIRLIPGSRAVSRLPQALRDFQNAARTAINDQIRDFRDKELPKFPKCPITGDPLHRNNCHVDHAPPSTFDYMLFEFCRVRQVNPLAVAVGSRDGTVAVLEDAEFLAAWRTYHGNHANLRLISKVGNLQLPRVTVPWRQLWE